MKLIQVLGPGCARCKLLEENTRKAAKAISLECEILKVTDMNAIMHMGVMMTPGLAIDGQVVMSGKVPTVEELKKLLKEQAVE